MMKLGIAVVLFVVLLSMSALGWCGAPIRDGDPGTIGACLTQMDGTTVTLPAEEVLWRGRSGKSFAIKERFEPTPKTPRLVVISTRSLPVDSSMTVDVTGTLSTVSGTSKDGEHIRQRVIITIPENVSVYCSPNGRPMVYPPVKGMGMEWSSKRTLNQLSGTSLSSISLMDGGGFPVLDDSPDSEEATPALGSRDSLKWLPDGTRVHLRNRLAIASVYSSKFSVEEPDRTNPIRVISNNSVVSGSLVDVVGTLKTVDGERVVQADYDQATYTDGMTVVDSDYAMPRPFGMNNKAIGGGSVGSFTPAVGSSSGANNTGMLATIWGKVTATDMWDINSNIYCCIDDGSGLDSGDGNTGIRVYPYDTLTADTYVSLTGIISSQTPNGSISVPVLYEVNDITYPTYSTGSGTISGTITAGTSAANATAWIHSTGGLTTCTLNAAGVGNYSLTVKPGDHTVSVDVAGYNHAAAKATVTANQTITKNFTLTSIGKGIYVNTSTSRIAPDGISTTTVTAVVYDDEGRRLPNQTVTWSVDVGTIVNSDSVTDNVGEATATVRSASSPGTANVSVTCIGKTIIDYVEFATPTAPSVRILTPTLNESVSGVVTINLQAYDPGGANTGIAQLAINVDGQPLSAVGTANPSTAWATYKLPNGAHTIMAAASDGDMEYGYSQSVAVTTSNEISCLSVVNGMFDANDSNPAKRITTISAQQDESADWQIEITKCDASSPTKVFTGSGTNISATWDGTDSQGNPASRGRYKYTISAGQAQGGMSGQSFGFTLEDYLVFLRTGFGPTALIVEGSAFWNNYELFDIVEGACEERGFQVITVPVEYATWANFQYYMTTYQPKVLYITTHGDYEVRRGTDCMEYPFPQVSQFMLNGCWVYAYRPQGYQEYPAPGSLAFGSITQYEPMIAHYVSELGLATNSPLKLVWMDSCMNGRIGSLYGDLSDRFNPYEVDFYGNGNDLAYMFGIYDNAYTIGASFCGYYEISIADDRYRNFLGRVFGSMRVGYSLDQGITRDAWNESWKHGSLYPEGIDMYYGAEYGNPCNNWRYKMPPYHNLRVHGNPYSTYLSPY